MSDKCITDIESVISDFLLKDILFVHQRSGKILKKGKLILFRFKEFHFNFTLKNEKGDHKIYEIPYPFRFGIGRDSIKFSYELEHFAYTDLDILQRVNDLKFNSTNKLFNSTVVLSGA